MERTEQLITLKNREHMTLTGVKDVSEFCETKVILKTSMGGLVIKGKKLSISQLDTVTGTLEVHGEVQSAQYTASAGEGFFAGLFE